MKDNVKAKEASKWGQIFSACWIAVLSILRGAGLFNGLTVMEIILTGLAIPLCFTPILVSIIIDKLKATHE